MTGYAAQTLDTASGFLALELRSVNSRFLDLHFRFADELRGLEPATREAIAISLKRGKVECRLSLTPDVSHTPALLNDKALTRLSALAAEASRVLPEASPLRLIDALRWPGVLAEARPDADTLTADFAQLLEVTLTELNACRAREGEKLAAAILEIARRIRAILAEIAPRIPIVQAAMAEKLRQRLTDTLSSAQAAIDDNRILQEATLFATRTDVAEELARLATHLDELERIFKTGGTVGKRLDFLMQEFNREANTLASKAASTEITSAALELKLLIEQIREQVQNLE
jgi:uncharacterized protein (TIGR00255 family)